MAVKHATVADGTFSTDGATNWNANHTVENNTITEAMLSIADNTTANVSTTAHGFAPKAPNDATKYLDGTGAYSVPAGGTAATQAEQETGTSTTVFTTPGRQHFHVSAAKAWCQWTTVTTTAINSSYNVSSLTDNGVGSTTVNFTTAFSTANYAVVIGHGLAAVAGYSLYQGTGANKSGSSVLLEHANAGATALVDAAEQCIACFGDQ